MILQSFQLLNHAYYKNSKNNEPIAELSVTLVIPNEFASSYVILHGFAVILTSSIFSLVYTNVSSKPVSPTL